MLQIRNTTESVNFKIFSISETSRSPFCCVYILQLIRFRRVCSNVSDFNNRNQFWLLRYLYKALHNELSKFYHRYPELIDKYSVDLKALLQQGISEPVFCCDLVYNVK